MLNNSVVFLIISGVLYNPSALPIQKREQSVDKVQGAKRKHV